MTKNMDLWDKVEKTDPKYTKNVGTRGGFTAINAMYQVREMTRQFGVIGEGWGFSYELVFPPNNTVIAKVTLWHGSKENQVHQAGQKNMDYSGKPDEDAIKKSITDGLTKCISLLGFNADIFLGQWDDNKYVEQRAKDVAKAEEKANWRGPLIKTKLSKAMWDLKGDLDACTDDGMLAGVLDSNIDIINQCKIDLPQWYHGDGDDIKGLAHAIEEATERVKDKA